MVNQNVLQHTYCLFQFYAIVDLHEESGSAATHVCSASTCNRRTILD